IPPTWSVDSSTITCLPCLASRYPAVNPAGPAPSTTTGRSRVISAPRFGAPLAGIEVSLIWSCNLPVEHCAVAYAASAPVVVRRHRDGLEAAVCRVGCEQRPQLGRASAHELRPGRLPALRTLR